MMRAEASRICHEELIKHGLKDWHVRINPDLESGYVGLCSHMDKCIILNAHHIDIHPDFEIINTIKHEVAHALVGPGHAHDNEWKQKAKEIGCDTISTVCGMSLDRQVIDAIRAGATIEVSIDEKIIKTTKVEEEVVKIPRYKITRLQDRCPFCGKVAVTVSEKRVDSGENGKHDKMFIKLECGHTLVKLLPKATPFHLFQTGGREDCKHEWTKNKCNSCGRFKPFDFQIEGMKFGEQALAINSGVAILDEMGLGKTIQAGGIINYHPELWPVLYVVKSGIKFQWFKFCLDWMGHVCQIIHTSSDILIPGLKGYIISYDMMVPKVKKMKKSQKIVQMGFDINKIINSPIKTIVLDECQQIKNPDSSRTQQIRQICKGRKVITLSGTPWKNRGGELYSMFNMIAPMKFSSNQAFLNNWVDYYWQGNFKKQGGIKNIQKFKEYIKDIAIRRERKDVMPELPTTQRTKLHVQMNLDETKEYDDAVEEFAKWYEESENDAASGINILGKISRLRHLTGVAKIPATLEHVEEFLEEKEGKLVIFVHHQDVGQSIFNSCKDLFENNEEWSVPVMQLTSALSPEERFRVQETFNKLPRCIMVASTLASGEGLNLQTGSYCIMHERQWNPANEEQAEGRFCRIGQTSPEIIAVYAQVAGSIDEYLDSIVENKRLYFHAAMNTGATPRWNESEIMKELADIIVMRHRMKHPKKVA
jgi:SWI/SNF-related matrix-associated actin-dependent regulator 1 of chromatin subfamily A